MSHEPREDRAGKPWRSRRGGPGHSLCVPAAQGLAPSPMWGSTQPSIARTENLTGVMLAVTGLVAPQLI